MFSVLFEVRPRAEQWDAYLDTAKTLRPELEAIDGFVDNIRYRSLTRDGWILSLSNWRDEKSLVRWRTHVGHHFAQEKGRGEILFDYHLRVGQITRDSHLPAGHELAEQRLDTTETGVATMVTLLDTPAGPGSQAHEGMSADAEASARRLGLDPTAHGLVAWDVFDAVLTPGEQILLLSWQQQADAEAFGSALVLLSQQRMRQVRIVRDYGKYDRREAPQYYPEVPRD
jgi:heme-degrading monooxygenase HmoA